MIPKISVALLEITKKCPLSCRHCYLKRLRTKKELTVEQWKKIMDILIKQGIKRVVLLGGEPTIYPGFWELLNYACDNFDMVNVETSGVTKTDFASYDCVVTISFEDCNPETNDYFRGEGTFKKALQKLQTIKNTKVLRGTIYDRNDVLGMAMLAEKVGANSVFIPLIPIGSGSKLNSLVPGKKRLLKVFKEIQQFNLVSKYRHMVDCPAYYIWNDELFEKFHQTFQERGRICSAGNYRIFIDNLGNVSPCPYLHYLTKQSQFHMGNILRTDIKKIYKNLEAFNERAEKLPVEGACSKCDYLHICGGGCLAVAFDNKSKKGTHCPIK